MKDSYGDDIRISTYRGDVVVDFEGEDNFITMSFGPKRLKKFIRKLKEAGNLDD